MSNNRNLISEKTKELNQQLSSVINDLSEEELKFVQGTFNIARERFSEELGSELENFDDISKRKIDFNYLKTVIGKLRSNLLDLSLRNPFIKFKNPKKSLELPWLKGSEFLDNFFKSKKRPLICPSKEENLKFLSDSETEGLENVSESIEDKIYSQLSAKELDKTLRYIERQSKSEQEESGCDTLHLLCGFLEYSTSGFEQVDDNQSLCRAPLLILKVGLQKTGRNKFTGYQDYALFLSEDAQIEDNETLREKLKQELGINLPTFSDDKTPKAYFEEVAQICRSRSNWKVSENIYLGFLSFKKLVLWNDLNLEENLDILQNTILRKIFCLDASEAPKATLSESCNEEFSIENHPMVDVPCIYDMDSSQHSALIDALDGKNMVIVGPPGTGKSQTITNLIALAMDRGKSVLFVCEKKAAIEVVKRKLEQAHLGEFCLDLHNSNTSSKAMLETIKKRLETSFEDEKVDGFQLRSLKDRRARLSRYVELLNKEDHTPQATSFHSLIWKTEKARLTIEETSEHAIKKLENIIWKDAIQWSEDDVYKRINLLENIKKYFVQLPNLKSIEKDLERLPPIHYPVGRNLESYLDQSVSSILEFKQDLELFFNSDEKQVIDTDTLSGDLQKFLENHTKFSIPRDKIGATSSILSSLDSEIPLNDINDAIEVISAIKSTVEDLSPFKWFRSFDVSQFELTESSIDDILISNLGQISQGIQKTLADLRSILRFNTISAHSLPIGNIVKIYENLYNLDPYLLNFSIGDVLGEFSDHNILTWRKLFKEKKELDLIFSMDCLPTIAEIQEKIGVLQEFSSPWKRWFSREFKKLEKSLEALSQKAPKSQKIGLENLKKLCVWMEKKESFFNENKKILRFFWEKFDTTPSNFIIFEKVAKDLSNLLEITPLSNAVTISKILKTLQDVKGYIHSFSSLNSLADPEFLWADIESAILNLNETLKRIKEAGHEFISSAFTLRDLVRLKSIKQDIESLLGLAKKHQLLRPINDQLSSLDKVILNDYLTILNIFKSVKSINFSRSFENIFISNFSNLESLSHSVKKLMESLSVWCDSKKIIEESGFQNLDVLSNKKIFDTDKVSDYIQDLRGLKQLIHLRDAWLQYKKLRLESKDYNLTDLIKLLESGTLAPQNLVDAFDYLYYQSAVWQIFDDFPELNEATGEYLDSLRSEFAYIDRDIIKSNGAKISRNISRREVPVGTVGRNISDFDNLALLKREFNKSQMHMPIRKLMLKAWGAISALKPCFLMSPISVAKYLNKNAKFDLLIIDEASQMRLPESLSSIMRSKQIVVVGDPKQLPPTSFFDTTMGLEDEESELLSIAEDSKSILETCMQSFQNARYLRWHYRSRHQDLIQFSNHNFYDDNLIVLPSLYNSSHGMGIFYNYVDDAVYSQGVNLKEAEELVKKLIIQLEQNETSSVGVVAMNVSQQNAIYDIFYKKVTECPRLYQIVQNLESLGHDVFIKNLENVQGDEREVIFISTVYGKSSESSVVRQNFGPINSLLGSRRLNVLFTRARQKIELFTSLQPEDVRWTESQNEGLRIFRDYLEFAKTGTMPFKSIEGGKPENPFEEAVANLLDRNGYQVVPQLGFKGYWIDLAVKNPDDPNGAYLAAIECDGATYHSSRSARDRDRIRQELLESLGWKGKVYRIWSTNWFKNSRVESEKLLNFLSSKRLNSKAEVF